MEERFGSIRETVRARVRAGSAWASGRPERIAGRWPSSTRLTRGLLTSIVAGGVVVVLVATLALTSLPGPKASSSSEPSSTAEASEPSAGPSDESSYPIAYDSPSFWQWDETPVPSPTAEPLPTEEPTPVPTQLPGTSRPRVLSKLDCTVSSEGRWQLPVVSGDVVYAACDGGDPYPGDMTEIRSFNAVTGKRIATYSTSTGGLISSVAVDRGLWYSADGIGHCVTNCTAWISKVYKMDLASKRVTFTLSGWYLIGDGAGYVWAEKSGGSREALMRIDPATNQAVQVPWHYARTEFECGGVWGLNASNASGQPATELSRVDPATGGASQVLTVSGDIVGLRQNRDGCWGIAKISAPGASPSAASSATADAGDTTYRYFRVQASGIEYEGSGFAADPKGGYLVLRDSSAWISWGVSGDPWTSIQRLDPVTGQGVGPVWALPSDDAYGYAGGNNCGVDISLPRGFEAGGSFWIATQSADCYPDLWRLNIPLALPAATPSPSPSPSPTA